MLPHPRHTDAEFLAFLGRSPRPPRVQLYIMIDKYSTQASESEAWLAPDPRIAVHSPTSGS